MADQQEFCLRWNDFHSNFHLSLEALRGDESFTDVTVSCGGRLVRAHRVILSACSVHFKEILRGIPSQQHPVIVLPTVDYEVMQAILEFIYQGQVNVKQSQLGAFLQVAETFSIQGLADDVTKKNAAKTPTRSRAAESEVSSGKRRRPEPARASPPPAAPSVAPAAAAAADKPVNINVSIKAEGMTETMVGELLDQPAPAEMLDPDMEATGSDVVAQAMATMSHESSDTSATMLEVPPRPPPPSTCKVKRSVVWEYFSTDGDTMICKLCGKRLRGDDGLVPFNSSNFWKHLRRMHDIV